MNKIVVHPKYFSSEDHVFDELEMNGMFIAEMDVPAVANAPHWHSFTTWMYILEGELHITDTGQDRTLTAKKGARVDVPERVLHCEESSGYKIIAGMTEMPAENGEVDLPPEAL
jgi:hypothetical protein